MIPLLLAPLRLLGDLVLRLLDWLRTDEADRCPECGGPMGAVEDSEAVGGGWVCRRCGSVDAYPSVCTCGAGWRAAGPLHAFDCGLWEPDPEVDGWGPPCPDDENEADWGAGDCERCGGCDEGYCDGPAFEEPLNTRGIDALRDELRATMPARRRP